MKISLILIKLNKKIKSFVKRDNFNSYVNIIPIAQKKHGVFEQRKWVVFRNFSNIVQGGFV